MKVIEIQKFGDDERRVVLIDNDDFAKGTYDEEGNFVVDENGEYKAFYSDRWHDELEFDIFNEIKDYKELCREIDYYGTGYDRITAMVDGEEVYLSASRWTSGVVEKGYVFKGWV